MLLFEKKEIFPLGLLIAFSIARRMRQFPSHPNGQNDSGVGSAHNRAQNYTIVRVEAVNTYCNTCTVMMFYVIVK
jgi:hypothetical protein